MNAHSALSAVTLRMADFGDANDREAISHFVAAHPQGSIFHTLDWIEAVECGTGQRALAIVAEQNGVFAGFLPLSEVHSPLFGRSLASSGFAVGGGALAEQDAIALQLAEAAQELAQRLSCSAVELRGGAIPWHWQMKTGSHSGFVKELAGDDEAQLLAIPRKQRAEVRKGLANDLTVEIGVSEADRAAHYAVYAESVRNLGTPVFPRSLFDAMLNRFGESADILTVRHEGVAVASVLSFYHRSAVLPYWGGGTWDARRLRANDRMYFELMLHARRRGCTHFDFGRSKTGSGPYNFKRNWGFEPEPMAYGTWSAPGAARRDTDPTSASNARKVDLWKRLPLAVANRIGPLIARGLG